MSEHKIIMGPDTIKMDRMNLAILEYLKGQLPNAMPLSIIMESLSSIYSDLTQKELLRRLMEMEGFLLVEDLSGTNGGVVIILPDDEIFGLGKKDYPEYKITINGNIILESQLEFNRISEISQHTQKIRDEIEQIRKDVEEKQRQLDAAVKKHDKKIKAHEEEIRTYYSKMIEIFGIFVAIFSIITVTVNTATSFQPSSVVELVSIAAVFATVTALVLILLLAIRYVVLDLKESQS